MSFYIAIVKKGNMQLNKLKKKKVWMTKLKLFNFLFSSPPKFSQAFIYPSISLTIIIFSSKSIVHNAFLLCLLRHPWVMNDQAVCLHCQVLSPYLKQAMQRNWLAIFPSLLIPIHTEAASLVIKINFTPKDMLLYWKTHDSY